MTARTATKESDPVRRRAIAGRVLAGMAVVTLFATGCGGDGDTGTSVGGGDAQPAETSSDPAGAEDGGAATQGDGDSARIPACVDVAEVAALVDHDMAVSDEPVAANWCSYVGETVRDGGVDYGYFGSMRSQIEERLDAGFESVPGVGEEATWTGEPGSGQLAVRTGDDVGYIIEVYGDLDLEALAIELAETIIDG